MANADVQVVKTKQEIMHEAMLHALAFQAMNGSTKDEISEREALKIYGKAWIEDRTERGWIHFIRNGKHDKSTKVYSRFEIECQKRAEKHIDIAYKRAEQVYKTNV